MTWRLGLSVVFGLMFAGAVVAESGGPPVRDRLRGIETRPPRGDVDGYVQNLVDRKANIVTLGTMNGQGAVFFETDLAAMHPHADPAFVPAVIRQLRQRDIGVLSWVVFNIQDTKRAEDFLPAARYPQWRMKFIEDPSIKPRETTGMCVVSSPYVEHHGKLLKQAAGFDLDGLFFDGFYFAGVPDRKQAGCVCEHCAEAFRTDTGLDLPRRVDWNDMTFKRWVRWRNERLLKTARYFQQQALEANPRAHATFNWNIWPFARKDWETAIPMWRVDDLGVSQHSYTGKMSEKWVMLGFKARIGRDMNPAMTDMWRATGYNTTCAGEPDPAWHELELTTWMLAGPTYGITPWHSVNPSVETAARAHEKLAKVEPYFSRLHVADVAVLASQNTHDFYGHKPGTQNLADYRDGLLGTWLLLTERHVPFEFIFDNQLDAKSLQRYRTLVLPNAACLGDGAVAAIKKWVQAGGQLITTGATGTFDEWGEAVKTPGVERFGIEAGRGDAKLGEGSITCIAADAGLAYCRERDSAAGDALVQAIRRRPLPLAFTGPPTVVANMFANPRNPKQRWVHLLNVAHLCGGGSDSGFRGLDLPTTEPSRGPIVPAKDLVIELPGIRPASARLVVAGKDLAIDERGRVRIDTLDLHEVVELSLP